MANPTPVHLILLVLLFTSSVYSQTYLTEINTECERECDSHFTGTGCWSKTYEYFSNQIIQSIVQYGNALNQVKKDSDSLVEKLNSILNTSYQDYKSQDSVQAFVKDVIPEFDSVFEGTLKQLMKSDLTRANDLVAKCGIKCESSGLTVWISLFSVLIGLTLATIGFFAAYVLFIKVQLQKYEKKVSTAANNVAAAQS